MNTRALVSRTALFWLLLAALVASQLSAAPRGARTPVPDLTAGGKPDENHDWTLGPTGARGWIWGWRGHTFDARQILITKVAASSPADGVLKVGDVILGVNGKPFSDDARVQFARAITAAERKENRGVLRLIRWRRGKTENVELKLAVMGSYSDTAPYVCAKSKHIFEAGCRAIAKKGLDRVSIPNDLNALALLASGKAEYRPLLAAYAKQVAAFETVSMATWHYGYAGLFLAEYCIATKDQSVMPGLRRIALAAAHGQSNVGTWGHKFSRPDGILNGYGAMNQPGLIMTITMVLAREAGVQSPDLDRAIDKAAKFLRWYVDKGAIPYGDHGPWGDHDDNGKCSSAAVLFDLLGDAEAVTFFAKMGTAAHAERESGHTGNFFNVLWAMPGVSRAGVKAAAGYLKETAWYYDLARAWDGSFSYQGTPANWNGHSYGNWDSTGAYLLTYALPLKSLYVTGKKPSVMTPLTAKQVAEVIDAGRGFDFWKNQTSYDGRTTAELLAGLKSWSPAVRNRSASSLGRRQEDVVPRLLKMLDSGDRYARYGACAALAAVGPRASAAKDSLLALLNCNDVWLRSLAATALSRLDAKTRKTITPALLELAARQSPDDPRGMVARTAAEALFSKSRRTPSAAGVLTESLTGADREALYVAIRALLTNEDGRVRGLVGSAYDKLTDDDLRALMPAILSATAEMAPSDVMFADGVRMAGLEVLSKLGIREGMPLCVKLIEADRWGQGRRYQPCLESLRRYGGHAKEVLPQLRAMRALAMKWNRAGAQGAIPVAIAEAIREIEADTNMPPLQSLAEFAKGGKR